LRVIFAVKTKLERVARFFTLQRVEIPPKEK